MSRKIRFRAWDKSENVYIHDYCDMDIFENYGFWSSDCFDYEQFTGLKDKNGVEIYEGDIVYIAGIGKCTVEWDNSILGFGFVQYETLSLWEFQEILEDIDSLEILGNIHENEDLLK